MPTKALDAINLRAPRWSLSTLLLLVTILCAFFAGRASMLPTISTLEDESRLARHRASAAEDSYEVLIHQKIEDHLRDVEQLNDADRDRETAKYREKMLRQALSPK